LRHHLLTCLLAAALLGPAGCSRPEDVRHVTGRVLLDGKPLAGAHVRFVPKGDLTRGEFGGTTAEDGTFSIRAGGPGMVARPGTFVALISRGGVIGAPPKPRKDPRTEEELRAAMKGTAPGLSDNKLPERYDDPETSPFKVEIQAGTTELAPFEMKSKP
jgi:hypothetical protein